MPTKPELFAEEDGSETYRNLRNGYTTTDVVAAMKDAWDRVWHLCPEGAEHFVSEFRDKTIARAWELFLMGVLDSSGFKLSKPPEEAPDICVDLPAGQRVWFEAIAPEPGKGPDAPPQRGPGFTGGSLFKEDKLHLRYTGALEEKYRKLKGYRDKGVVSSNDALVIAVFEGGILYADLHNVTMPSIVKVLFGLGEEYLEIIPYSDEQPKPGIKRRLHIEKTNKANVPAAFFHDPKTDIISAVLQGDTFMRSTWRGDDSLTLVHRPGALVPIQRGTLPTKCEMWVDPATDLLEACGRCARHGIYSGEDNAVRAAEPAAGGPTIPVR